MQPHDPALDTTITDTGGCDAALGLLSDADVQRLGDLNEEYYPQIRQAKTEAEKQTAREHVRQQVEERLKAEGNPWADVWAHAVAHDYILHDAKYRVMIDWLNDWVRRIEEAKGFGRFSKAERLGAGGFGVVFKARDSNGPRSIAIKVPHVPPDKMPSDRNTVTSSALPVLKFFEEARKHASINVQGCVPLHEVGMPEIHAGQVQVDQVLAHLRQQPIWFSMQLVEGRSLERDLKPESGTYEPGTTITDNQVIDLMTRIAEILQTLHATPHPGGNGYLIHKDLKPANILRDRQSQVWISDFGLATPRGDQAVFGNPISGTLLYMAPELLKTGGEPNYANAQTDIYAWGAIFYEVLVGHPPFSRSTFSKLRDQILHTKADSLAIHRPEIPPYLDRIIQKCLEKKREDRYQSFAEVLRALNSRDGEAVPSGPALQDVIGEREQREGPGFVRNWQGSNRLPTELAPPKEFVGRLKEIETLRTRLIPKGVVPITGPQGSGKTSFKQRFFSDKNEAQEVAKHFPRHDLSLIHLDPSSQHGPMPVTRAFLFAMGEQKASSLGDLPVAKSTSAIVSQLLDLRLPRSFPVAVIENAQSALLDGVACADLVAFLLSIASHNGATALLTRPAHIPDDRAGKFYLQMDVTLDPLDVENVKELLLHGLQRSDLPGDDKADLAKEVAEQLVGLSECMYPGVIVNSVVSALRTASRVKRRVTANDITNEIIKAETEIERKELAGLGCALPAIADETLTQVGTLIVCAVILLQPFTIEAIRKAALSVPSLVDLQTYQVLVEVDGQLIFEPLFGRALRRLLPDVFATEGEERCDKLFASALDRLLGAISESHPSDINLLPRATEEALAWVEKAVPKAVAVQDKLREYMAPSAVDDLIYPMKPEEATAFAQRAPAAPSITAVGRLNAALARLSAGTRFHEADAFFPLLSSGMEAADEVSRLTGEIVRILDAAAYIATRRYGYARYTQLLTAREQLIPRLRDGLQDEQPDLALLKWTTSWFLNSAWLCLALGRMDQAQEYLLFARDAHSRFPPPTSRYALQDALDFRDRIARIGARLVPANRQAWQIAFEATGEAIELTAGHPRWLQRFLRATRDLVGETATSQERTAILDEALARLARAYQFEAIEAAPLPLRTRISALLRYAADLESDPGQRLERAKIAVSIIGDATNDLKQMMREGDSRGLLALIGVEEFVGTASEEVLSGSGRAHFRKACDLARNAVEIAPTVAAWRYYLRLLDRTTNPKVEWSIESERQQTPIHKLLHKAIAAYQAWEQRQETGSLDGSLALWCIERKWEEKGGLSRASEEQLAADQEHGTMHPNAEWRTLKPYKRREYASLCYKQRRSQLTTIQTTFGQFPELVFAFARLERQYQRLLALPEYEGNGECDHSPVIAILSEAQKLFPANWSLVAEEARYYRYVWDYRDAIKRYREAVQMARRSEDRRKLRIALAETLLTAAIHGAEPDLGDRNANGDRIISRHPELVAEASQCLEGLHGFRHITTEAAVLRDLVDFEAGRPIDWARIEATYSLVVNDDYIRTILSNLNQLREQDSAPPEHMADVVKANFTSVDVLRDFGTLLLRHAELDANIKTAVEDAERAYFVFIACRMFEKSFLYCELPITRFKRARAILVAARKAGSVNPFPKIALEDKGNGLELAESLFSGVVSRTVGMFHQEARRRVSEVARLRNALIDGK